MGGGLLDAGILQKQSTKIPTQIPEMPTKLRKPE
jgi:hypothetical protein